MPDTEFAPDALDVTAQPRSVEDAREAIAQTRERISATLDAIELRIDQTRQDIRRKADVLRPVRERIGAAPWTALGIAAGAGLALGLLTGGDSRADDEHARERARARRRARHLRHEHASGGNHGEESADARAGVKLQKWMQAVRAERRGRASAQENLLHHLLPALSGAISAGISARIRRRMMD